MQKVIATIIVLMLLPLHCFALNVGIITDIHAGKKSKRKAGSSIVYPKKAVSYFDKALARMNGQVDLVVVLGDNTNKGKRKYYKKLKKVEQKHGLKVLWVKGNHDDKDNRILSPGTYIHDQDGIRFIVLDTTLCPKKQINGGCFHQSQIDFLNAHKTKNTIVLQHHAPLIEDTCTPRPGFESEDGMTVWSGHWHEEMTCGKVKIFPALTEHKRLEYRIIKL